MADMKPPLRQAMNKKDGKRVTLRLTAEQEQRLAALDRRVRRKLTPALRRRIDPILTTLENKN
jgi:predicted DNA-binding protein